MKRLILAIVALTLVIGGREIIVEEKQDGFVTQNIYEAPDGASKSRYTRYFPYVCYRKRIRIIYDGEEFLRYKGCFRSSEPCRAIGFEHFGRYPNDYEAYKALIRCKTSRPRFVD